MSAFSTTGASANPDAESPVAESYSLYALHATNFAPVCRAISFLNPTFDQRKVETQAELFILDAFHQAAHADTSRWNLQALVIPAVGIGMTAVLGTQISGLPTMIELLPAISSIIGGAIFMGGFNAGGRIRLQTQADIDRGYVLNSEVEGTERVYRKAQQRIDVLLAASAKYTSTPAPTG